MTEIDNQFNNNNMMNMNQMNNQFNNMMSMNQDDNQFNNNIMMNQMNNQFNNNNINNNNMNQDGNDFSNNNMMNINQMNNQFNNNINDNMNQDDNQFSNNNMVNMNQINNNNIIDNMNQNDSQFSNNNMMNMTQMNNQFNNNINDNINQNDSQFSNNNMMNMTQMNNQFNNNINDNINQSDNQFNNNDMMIMTQMNNQFNNNINDNINQSDNQFNNNSIMNMNQMNNQFNNNINDNINQGHSQINNNSMNQINNQLNNNINNNIDQGDNPFNNNINDNLNQGDNTFNNNIMMNMNQMDNQFNNNSMMNMNQMNNQFNNNSMMNMNQGENPFNNNSMINTNQINDQFNRYSMMNMNQSCNLLNDNNMMNMNQINEENNNNNNNQNNFMNNFGRKSMSLKYPTNFAEYNLDINKKELNSQRTEINTFDSRNILLDEEIDAYPYIKEEKKLIIFERNDKKQFKVKIPSSLRNNELYFTAIKYKINEYSEMELFHKNNLLENDDSPIDDFSEDKIVIIVEFLDELKDSYYIKEYLPTLNKNDIINIIFKFTLTSNKKSMTFSKKTKIKDMLKMFFQESKILEKGKPHYRITYDSITLNFNDESPIGDIFKYDGAIAIVDKIEENYAQGKQLKVFLKNKNKSLLEITTGTLEQIKSFYYNLEQNFLNNKKIKKVIIKGKAINKDDESTFASCGIRKDFTCNILFMGDQESKEDYIDKDEKGIFKKISCFII